MHSYYLCMDDGKEGQGLKEPVRPLSIAQVLILICVSIIIQLQSVSTTYAGLLCCPAGRVTIELDRVDVYAVSEDWGSPPMPTTILLPRFLRHAGLYVSCSGL